MEVTRMSRVNDAEKKFILPSGQQLKQDVKEYILMHLCLTYLIPYALWKNKCVDQGSRGALKSLKFDNLNFRP